MNAISVLTAILTLIAGIGVFLMACHMMSTHLENAGSQRLKQLFARVGESKWMGVGIGTVGTAAIQSSGAVTVMVIGFVNVGIMSLTQAATIIYGANIGTTVTAQLVALGMLGGNGISTTVLFSAFAGIGAFILMFSKRESWKHVGGILTGFGTLFVGLSMMSNAMDDFAALDSVKQFLASIKNPLLIVFLGALLTAIIQSSSVLTSIAITMVVAGLLSLDQGIYLTMGSNIGSCVVAILAGMTSGTNAKRTALIHLFFNIMGVAIFLLIALALRIASKGMWSFGSVFEHMFPHAPQIQLAMFHTVFNVCTTLLALPLTDKLVQLVCRLVSDKEDTIDNTGPRLYFLDDTMLSAPVLAVKQLKAEIENMAKLAMENFKRSIKIVTTMNFEESEQFANTEKELNYLNSELLRYMVLLSEKRLNQTDLKYLNASIRSVSDLERIGDYAENIVEYAESLRSQSASFSAQAVSEIHLMERRILDLYNEVSEAYHNIDGEAMERAYVIEEDIDNLTEQMERNHIQRLVEGKCTPQVGAEYLSLAQNAERIADHLVNVGNTIRE